jgi:hypothetical protein
LGDLEIPKVHFENNNISQTILWLNSND